MSVDWATAGVLLWLAMVVALVGTSPACERWAHERLCRNAPARKAVAGPAEYAWLVNECDLATLPQDPPPP